MKYALPVVFLVLSIHVDAQFKNAPVWVKNPPSEEFAYYGIGQSSPKEEDDYRINARNMALREITEKIFVSIDATSELQVKYANDKITYKLDETIEVASSNFLSGYELIDQWTSKRGNDYFVLYRLDKSEYLRNRNKYFEEFNQILDLLSQQADHQLENGQLIRGINELSEAIMKIEEKTKGLIEPEYKNPLVRKKLEMIYKIEQAVSRIKFDVEKNYALDVTQSSPLAINDYIIDAITGKPIQNVNISIESVKGDVFRYHIERNTNRDALFVDGIFPENGITKFRIIAKPVFYENVEELLDRSVLQRLSSPIINVEFKPYTVKLIQTSEYGNSLNDFIRSITKDLGLQESTEDPFYYIKIDAENKPVKRGRYGFQSFFKGTITVFEEKDGIPIFSYKLEGTSEFKRNKNLAMADAYENSIAKSSKFLVEFVSFLCSK